MTGWRDEVRGTPVLDERSIDAVLRGNHVSPEMDQLADLVQMIRSAAVQPVQPVGELADRMATGEFVSHRARRRASTAQPTAKSASTSLRTKVAAGITLTLTGLTGATAAGALPDVVADPVEAVIEFITPFDLSPDTDGGADLGGTGEGGTDSQRISYDAPADEGRQAEDASKQTDAAGLEPVDTGGVEPADLRLPAGDPGQQLASIGAPAGEAGQSAEPEQQVGTPGQQPAEQGGRADPGQQPVDRGRPEDPGRKPADPGEQGNGHGLQHGRDHAAQAAQGRAPTALPTPDHVQPGPPVDKPSPKGHAKVNDAGTSQGLSEGTSTE
jgi:hypothetical protein